MKVNDIIKLVVGIKREDGRQGSTLYDGSIKSMNIYGDIGDYNRLIADVSTSCIHGDAYSQVDRVDEELSLISYCEGDVYIEVYNNEKEYKRGIKETQEFYENEY